MILLTCYSPFPKYSRSVNLLVGQEEPGIQHRIRVQGYRIDTLVHQPLGQVRMIRRALTANADVLTGFLAGLDGVRQQRLHRVITLIEQVGNNAGVPVQAQSQLGQVVGTNGEAIKVLQELLRQNSVGRQLTHHDHAQTVLAALQAIFCQQAHYLLGFTHCAHKRNHHFHVGEAHLITHFFQGTAFQLETVTEGFRDVAGRTTEAQHRVLFVRLIQSAANEVGVLVGFEVRQANNHLLRRERSCQGGNAFNQLFHVEIHWRIVTGNALVDGLLDVTGQAVVVQQRFRVNTDHPVNDELQAGQANAFVRQRLEVKGTIRVAHVHHDLERNVGHGIDGVLTQFEVQRTLVDHTGVAFGAGHSHFLAIVQQLRGITTTDYRRDTQLTGNDRRVAGTTTTIGHNSGGPLHYRFPVRVGHVGNQHVAGLNTIHFIDAGDNLHRATADLVADTAAFNQHLAGFFQQIALHHVGRGTTLDGFRAGLNDVDLAVIAVFGPLDVHRALVVLFDDHGLLGQFFYFRVGDGEAVALVVVYLHGLHKLTFAGLGMVNHLDGLAAQVTAQHRRTARFQGRLVYIEFVRVYRALYHCLAQAIGRGDKHHVTETGFSVQGKHDAAGSGFTAHHFLDTGRQRHQLVVKAVVNPVGNRTVVEQGGKYFFYRNTNLLQANHVQEGFLLASERCIRQVFRSRRRTNSNRHGLIAIPEFRVGFFQGIIKNVGERGVDHPLANLCANPGQFVNIVNVQGIQGFINAVFQAIGGQEFPVGVCSCCKTARNGNTCIGEITDHFTEGSVLASNTVNIGHSQVVKPDNVIFQSVVSLESVWRGVSNMAAMIL